MRDEEVPEALRAAKTWLRQSITALTADQPGLDIPISFALSKGRDVHADEGVFTVVATNDAFRVIMGREAKHIEAIRLVMRVIGRVGGWKGRLDVRVRDNFSC